MKNIENPEWQELRSKLPGYEHEMVLASNKGKKLIYKYRIAGCSTELIASSCYWVVAADGRTYTYGASDLDGAVVRFTEV